VRLKLTNLCLELQWSSPKWSPACGRYVWCCTLTASDFERIFFLLFAAPGGYESGNKMYHAFATVQGIKTPGKTGGGLVSIQLVCLSACLFIPFNHRAARTSRSGARNTFSRTDTRFCECSEMLTSLKRCQSNYTLVGYRCWR